MSRKSNPSLTYPWEDFLPEFGTLKEVGPDVFWVRLPLPFALDHINVWLLRDEIDGQQGWTLIDTGVALDEQKAIWERIFAEHLEGLPILRVLVTHMHPDHVGLAGWHCQRWNAPLWMSMTDYMVACMWLQPASDINPLLSQVGQATATHFQSHGLSDPQLLEQIRARDGYYPSLVSNLPPRFHRILHGDTIRIGQHDWEVIIGYGHAPEHISLWCPEINVFISGDMLLPRISTNVSVQAYEPGANPLTLYLRSLDRYAHIHKDAVVLPSHGRPFRGVHERIRQQHEHHDERLKETYDACANGGLTAAELVPIMFRRTLDAHQMNFAMGEAIAHLHALYYEDKLQRRLEDGVYRFYQKKD